MTTAFELGCLGVVKRAEEKPKAPAAASNKFFSNIPILSELTEKRPQEKPYGTLPYTPQPVPFNLEEITPFHPPFLTPEDKQRQSIRDTEAEERLRQKLNAASAPPKPANLFSRPTQTRAQLLNERAFMDKYPVLAGAPTLAKDIYSGLTKAPATASSKFFSNIPLLSNLTEKRPTQIPVNWRQDPEASRQMAVAKIQEEIANARKTYIAGQVTDARNANKQPNVAGLEALQAKKNFAQLQTNLQNPKNLRAIASMLARTPLNPLNHTPVGGALTDALAVAGAESLRPEPPPPAPTAPQQSGLMSILSNPYVLGGAGLGALGLGGYGLARYLNRKKKKRPYFE